MSQPPFEQKSRDPFPPGAINAFYFQFFNTASFGTIIGVPMILFFKELGANVFILGVVTSIAPLLIILQIPASHFVERIGYRRFVLNGWTIRTFFGLGMALTALLPNGISNQTRIAIAIFFLLGYNVSRGISTCGFMPWITQLIPEKIRGQFVATDQMTGSIAGLFSTLLIAGWLHYHSNMIGYAAVFMFSSLTGFLSIRYLKKIPDVPVPENSETHQPIEWKVILSQAPFRRLLLMNFIFHIGAAGGGLFWVPLLKDHFQKPSGLILLMVALSSFFAIGIQYISSHVIDRTGSKPALTFAILMGAFHFFFWGLIAAHIIPLHDTTLFFIVLSGVMAFPLFNIANTRLIMSTAPALARSHSFAIFSVTVNLTLGIFPWIWGYGIDLLKLWNTVIGGHWQGNAYSLFYLIASLFLLLAWIVLLRVEEEHALTTEEFIHELFVKTPKQAITRILNRRPLF